MRLRSPALWSTILLLVKFCLASHDELSSSKLEWTSPSQNAEYASGDTIVGQWTASKAVVSPSVSLCTDSSDGGDTSDDSGGSCGETVWPSVKQDGNNYSFSL